VGKICIAALLANYFLVLADGPFFGDPQGGAGAGVGAITVGDTIMDGAVTAGGDIGATKINNCSVAVLPSGEAAFYYSIVNNAIFSLQYNWQQP
jgi:hypothetical protein